jgi:hypothetical protein
MAHKGTGVLAGKSHYDILGNMNQRRGPKNLGHQSKNERRRYTKAVGELQSRPVYGNFFFAFWKLKKRGRGDQKSGLAGSGRRGIGLFSHWDSFKPTMLFASAMNRTHPSMTWSTLLLQLLSQCDVTHNWPL